MNYNEKFYLDSENVMQIKQYVCGLPDKESKEIFLESIIEKIENSRENIKLLPLVEFLDCLSMQYVLEIRENSKNSYLSLAAHMNMVNRLGRTKHSELFENKNALRGIRKIKKRRKLEWEI